MCCLGLVLEFQLLDVFLHSLDGVLQVVIVNIVELVLLVQGQLPACDGVTFQGLIGIITPGHHIEGVSKNACKEGRAGENGFWLKEKKKLEKKYLCQRRGNRQLAP